MTRELAIRHELSTLTWTGNVLRLAGCGDVQHVDTHEMTTTIILRDRFASVERRPAASTPTPGLSARRGEGLYDYGTAGFVAEIDVASLAPGHWSAYLQVSAQGVVKQAPLGSAQPAVALASWKTTGRPPNGTSLSRGRNGGLTLVVHEPDRPVTR